MFENPSELLKVCTGGPAAHRFLAVQFNMFCITGGNPANASPPIGTRMSLSPCTSSTLAFRGPFAYLASQMARASAFPGMYETTPDTDATEGKKSDASQAMICASSAPLLKPVKNVRFGSMHRVFDKFPTIFRANPTSSIPLVLLGPQQVPALKDASPESPHLHDTNS